VTPDLRGHIAEGRLLLISAVSPAVRFTVWNAMARNRLIYTLCDYVLAVSTSDGKGGTWSGAVEDLNKRWVPLFVRSGRGAPPGNEALLQVGAMKLTEADLAGGDRLRGVLEERANGWAARRGAIAQAELPYPDGS
jgi:predicted Rossmann fold nucleotide-binding protein DprA/Smf involved in DNA uptake